jgi:hypothetical protein
MSQNLAVQGCRIVPPERLPDRFMAVDMLRGSSNQPGVPPVVLSYIFEVTKPWFPSSHLVPSLQEILEQHLPLLQTGPTIVDQFESLLKKINLQLNEISESGETDWIGNFNALIMVIAGDELHFSQAGFCPTYILQNRRIRQITDEEHEGDPHPLKTFSNLASGNLQADDIILIANPELYKEISLDALRRTLSSVTPYKACDTIAKELKKEKNASVAMVTLKVMDPGTAATLPAEPEAVLMEEIMQSTLAKVKRVLRPVAHKTKSAAAHIGRISVDAARQTGTIVKDQVIPVAGQMFSAGSDQIKHAAEKIKETAAKPAEPTPEAPATATEPTPEPAIPPIVEIITAKGSESAPETVEPTKPDKKREPNIIIPLDDFALDSATPPPPVEKPAGEAGPKGTFLRGIWASVAAFFAVTVGQRFVLPFIGHCILLFQQPRYRRLSYLFLALILIGTSFLVITHRKPATVANNTSDKNDAILVEVKKLTDRVDTAVAANQIGQVNELVNEADTSLNTLTNPTDTQKSTAEELWTALQTKFDTASKTNRLTTALGSYAFPSPSDGLIVVLPYFYGFNGSNLLRTGIGDSSVTQKTIPLPTNDGDTIVDLCHSTDTGSVGLILTKKARVYRIVQSDTTTTLVPISSISFNTGDRIITFNGNIYILDFRSGLLWKYLKTDTGYQKGVTAIDNTKYDLRNTASMAIDGAIYLLRDDATLDKFYSGKKQDSFTLTGIPQGNSNLIKSNKLITDEDMSSIFLLDSGKSSSIHSTARLLVFNKDGAFTTQYGFPASFTNVRSIDVIPQRNKLWVLNGSQVSEFNM